MMSATVDSENHSNETPHPAALVWLALKLGLEKAKRMGSDATAYNERLDRLALSALLTGAGVEHVLEALNCLQEALRHPPKRRGRPKKTLPGDPRLMEVVRQFPTIAAEQGVSSKFLAKLTRDLLGERPPFTTPDQRQKAVSRAMKAADAERRARIVDALMATQTRETDEK